MDQIRIENLEVYCHHGVLKEENILGQKFLVSLTLFTNTRKAGCSDDLSFSINYADVSHFVEQRMKEKNYQLIEAVAEHLAKDLLIEFPLIEQIQVEIKKPWAPILLPLDTVSVCITRGWQTVYLSIGANLGDKEKNICSAIELLKQDKKCKNIRVSELMITKPYGVTDQPDFLNGAIVMQTMYQPEELLERLHEIEAAGQRVRDIHWGPRTIDLDILLYEDMIYQSTDLIIPHMDMKNRLFVLEPLAEIAPYQEHPVYHKSIIQMLEELKGGDE